MKKITIKILIIVLFAVLIPPSFIFAQDGDVEVSKTVIEVFERDDCGHCQDFFAFIEDLETQRDDFKVVNYDIYTDEGKALFDEVTEGLKIVKGTPVIFVANTIIEGFDNADTTGTQIISLLDEAAISGAEYINFEQALNNPDVVSFLSTKGATCTEEECVVTNEFLVTIPLINKTIDVGSYSLPFMSIVLGTIDGFNPCAMWVLVMFLTILVGLGNKRKMMEIAGLFILAEAVMYYLILTVWLFAWDFIGLDKFITPLVGLIAIGGGIFFLWEYKKSDGTCQVTNIEQRSKITSRIKEISTKPLTIATALAIIAIAFSVNIIEFACSIGIPQAFTKILDINAISWAMKQVYNLIYIVGYMIDDIIVFGIAIYSFEKIGLTTKYARMSNLIGGILMIALGLILIFKHQWLIF